MQPNTLGPTDKTIVVTANIPSDVSMIHIGASLSKEYEANGWRCVGAMEDNLGVCTNFPYIVLNRVGVLEYPDDVYKANIKLVESLAASPDHYVTYYMDDLLMHLNDNKPIEFMKRAENVVVSNYVLKDYVEKYCFVPEAKIVQTHVNYDFVDMIKPADYSPIKPNTFSILWGSIGRIGIGFMDKVMAIMNDDSEFRGIQFLCIGMNIIRTRMKLIKYRNLKLNFREAISLDGFFALAKTCDLLINPVSTDQVIHFYTDPNMQQLWLDCKCAPKFALAGALRKPILSGKMRAYRETINDGVDGFISDEPEEWVEIIRELMRNKDLCDYIGNNARGRAETDYDYKQRTKEYITAFTNRGDDDVN